jgi:hypothetical protein
MKFRLANQNGVGFQVSDRLEHAPVDVRLTPEDGFMPRPAHLPPRLDLDPIAVRIGNRNVERQNSIGRPERSIPIAGGIRRDDFEVDPVVELPYDLFLVTYAVDYNLPKKERLAAIGQVRIVFRFEFGRNYGSPCTR